jgi:hypothetical protein
LCPAHISPSERVQFGKSQNLNSFKMCFEVKMGAQLRHLEVELRKLKKQMDVGFSLWGCCLSVPVNFKAQCPNSPCRRHLRWLWSWACVTVRCPWLWVSPTLGPRRDVRDRESQLRPSHYNFRCRLRSRAHFSMQLAFTIPRGRIVPRVRAPRRIKQGKKNVWSPTVFAETL